ADESEARKFVSPEYAATTAVEPAAVKVYVQVWLAVMSGIVHSTLLLVSLTVAEPVGVPPNAGVIVTVNVTSSPTTDGSGAAETLVVVVAASVSWLAELSTEPLKFWSPAYVAT